MVALDEHCQQNGDTKPRSGRVCRGQCTQSVKTKADVAGKRIGSPPVLWLLLLLFSLFAAGCGRRVPQKSDFVGPIKAGTALVVPFSNGKFQFILKIKISRVPRRSPLSRLLAADKTVRINGVTFHRWYNLDESAFRRYHIVKVPFYESPDGRVTITLERQSERGIVVYYHD